MEEKYFFSFDAETNGLWAEEAFCISGVVLDKKGEMIDSFIGRCPIKEKVIDWVAENVLPQLEDIPVSYSSYHELLEAFSAFWLKWKDKIAVTVTHMGMIIEAKLIRDMHNLGFIGDWEAPYVTADCASFEEVGDSVDNYAKTHNISVENVKPHNPLYDALIAGLVYLDVIKK